MEVQAGETTALLEAQIHATEIPPKQKSTTPTPVPWRPLIVICMLFGIQPLAYELVFPFVNQMIVEIGIVDDPEQVGFYSGFIESIFALMSFLAIMPCGYFSDRYGRKPVVLIGTVGLALSTSLFGLSRTFWAMVLTRCLAGATAGSWSALRIMLGEMTDKTNQGKAFSWLMIAYRIGQIIGHPLGGFLAHPERSFPRVFDSPFWRAYPFSLPCFVAGGFASGVVLIGFFFLQETKSKVKARRQTDAEDHQNSQKPSLHSVLTPELRLILLSSCTMALGAEMVFSLYPLFAFTPLASGGLGVNEATIGTHMAIRATINICIMLVWDPIQKRLGTVKLYQTALGFWPVTFACFPLLNLFAKKAQEDENWRVILNVSLVAFWFIWSFATLAWTGSGILVNDSATSPEVLATINGISQMAYVAPQAIAPAFATSLFAYSLKTGWIGGHLVWVVMVGISAITCVYSLGLKESGRDWRDDRDVD